MTVRHATAVIVKVTTLKRDGSERTLYYGPFLPHAGSATTSFMRTIRAELAESGRYESWDVSAEDVYLAAGESDCAIQATR